MDVESFRIAKEINSLTLKKAELTLLITQEQCRVSFIEENRTERDQQSREAQDQLQSKKAQLQIIENEIAKVQIQIDKDKEHLKGVTSSQQLESLELALDTNIKKVNALENDGLTLMEEMDRLEIIILECKEFLKGSQESLDQISKEVSDFKQEHDIVIASLDERIQLLLEQLPLNFKERILKAFERKIKVSIFSRIQNESCEFCKLKLSKMDVTHIEDKLELKTCQGCGRIFLPQQSFY